MIVEHEHHHVHHHEHNEEDGTGRGRLGGAEESAVIGGGEQED